MVIPHTAPDRLTHHTIMKNFSHCRLYIIIAVIGQKAFNNEILKLKLYFTSYQRDPPSGKASTDLREQCLKSLVLSLRQALPNSTVHTMDRLFGGSYSTSSQINGLFSL